MQGIQPNNLSNEELLRYAYTVGYDKLDEAWVKALAERLAQEIDKRRDIFHEGFEEGFEQGVEHATDDFK